uniref:dihydroorotase n=1 Tax=Paulinella chromatophora TaxID=39717 RepID=B1X3E9_PAUCH|nr:dihydroorotase [Paulinella chromatophora]ACB42468.1 dihydroorotase [Paulinella chromatophora]
MISSTLIILQPDDWHVHLRDGSMLAAVLPFTTRVFGRAIVMPNLKKPITTVESAIAYRKRIKNFCAEGITDERLVTTNKFNPLMTMYLTDTLDSNELVRGHAENVIIAAKLYPAGVTTNSVSGVTDIKAINPLLETMEKIGMPLLIHGEVNDPEVDIFDRERIFIEKYLIPLHRQHQGLKIVLEHITTADAVSFIESTNLNICATVTPHHLHLNRNAMFQEGLCSDFYCLPVLKRDHHKQALRRAVTSGNPKFFLGTDSAPHPRNRKETSCGCAGIFNASHAIESYTQVFEEEGKLDLLEAFTSKNGPKFYGLPLNQSRIVLEKKQQLVPKQINWIAADHKKISLVPLHAGKRLLWSLKNIC